MSTIEIGGSSSRCIDCYENHKPSSASPNESGHFTVLGWDIKVNGTAGCRERWDRVVCTYMVQDRDHFISYIKSFYTPLASIPDDDWQVFAWDSLDKTTVES